MTYPNLRKAMKEKKITVTQLAKELDMWRETLSNKLHGHYPFTIEEAFTIRDCFFPEYTLEYLFRKAEE